LKLTTENQPDLEQNIDWEQLPSTFQNGILVAWHLGLHYIWIDSLCIIKNLKSDWEIEAAKMGDIYHHAYLTVAASSSPSGDISFLRKRSNLHDAEPVSVYKPGKVSLVTRVGRKFNKRQGVIFARRTPRTATSEISVAGWSKNGAPSNNIPGPLSTRAWCLQERILSSRIVHFTEEGLIWECKQTTESEDDRSWTPGPLSKWDQFQPTSNLPNGIGRSSTSLWMHTY